MSSRLKEMYDSEIKAGMMKKFGYKNEMQIPKLVKIVVNMGVGDAKENHKLLDAAVNDMQIITGQKAVICKAKKSVANFKLREGMPIGCKVTLRGDKMYEFADRLINVALPHVRDFHGVPRKSFDAQGNYSLGLKEQTVFPEISFEDAAVLHGVEITFVIKNGTPEGSAKLLEKFGMPFEKEAK